MRASVDVPFLSQPCNGGDGAQAEKNQVLYAYGVHVNHS
jgi:hypothetical protein